MANVDKPDAISGSAPRPPDRISRDWVQNPAVAVVNQVPKVMFVMGDVHGDYDTLVRLLQNAHVIDQKPASAAQMEWAGKDAVLVCTGDLLDKGKQSIDVLNALMALQASAAKAGGRVIVTMGNHEVEFLSNNKGYEKKEDKEQFQKWLTSNQQLAQVYAGTDKLGPKGASVGRWLQNLPVGARVADWFFCHAGNTEGKSIAEIEKAVRDGVSSEGFGTKFLARPDSMVEARLGDDKDNFWSQGGKKESGSDLIARYEKALGVNHLVMGHQPGKVEFPNGDKRENCQPYSHFKNAATGLTDELFLIDTCNSHAVQEDEGLKDTGVILQFTLRGKPDATQGTLDVFDESGKKRDMSKVTGWKGS